MNWRKSFSAANIVMLLALILPNLLAGVSAVRAADGETQYVHIPASATAGIGALGLSPMRAIDYGAFYWLELSGADFTRLQASNVPYVHVPEAGNVQVTSYVFDPLAAGEPSLPAGMRANGSGAGFRLVQFVGPIRDEWLNQLETAGLRVLQYYPYHSYLVWGTAAQAEAVEALDFVRWTGAFHPAYKVNKDLDGRTGQITNVDIMFYNDGNIQGTLEAITRLGGSVVQYYPSQPDRAFFDAIVSLDADVVNDVARLNTVLWLGYSHPEPVLEDEMSSQIVAGNYTGGVPFTGYMTWLNNLGLSGDGVIWAIIDTGVDYQHPDLGPHIVGGHDYPGACTEAGHPGTDCPGGGHGTHVAGIVGGDATAGYMDPQGFLYGLGIAPDYWIFASNSLSAPAWPPSGGWQEHSKWAVLGGAVGGNNSWTTGEGTNHGYQASERTHDIMVLDGNFDTATVAEPFIEVFSAGNSGPGSYTLTAPKEAKNLTIVASSRNYRVGSIDTISSFSSRGPAQDGRWVPTIATPGEQIASSRNDTGGSCSTPIAGTNNMYAYCSGTSMAAPHTSGSIVLITEWWRNSHSGANPSSAMAKALLVNGAVDMGTADIPNINEGWGRVNLTRTLDPIAPTLYYDLPVIFANTGETWQITVDVIDPSQPLRVTLAWADAPGAVGANPALVNNLDLTVVNGSNTYLGNVFSGGWSNTGGTPDTRNNLENVYVQTPADSATITVQATNIAGDAVLYNGDPTDQSFALVCYNCVLGADFTLSADPVTQAICAPDDALYDITVGSMMGFSDPVSLFAYGYPGGTTASFDVNPVNPPGTSMLTIGNTAGGTAGSYDIDIVGIAPTSTHTVTVGLDLYTAPPAVPVLLTPPDGASNQPLTPAFDWEDLALSSGYSFELALTPLFEAPVVTATGLTSSDFTVGTALDGGTCYWWRAQGENACGAGAWAEPFHFSTVALGVSFYDDMESGSGNWTHAAGAGTDQWVLSTSQSHSPTHSWFHPDPSTVHDVRLWTTNAIAITAGSELTFWHLYDFENNFDGAVLEYSTNGGSTWLDMGTMITANGYDGTISTGYSNPLGGRQAWTATDHLSWTQVSVNLNTLAGQNVMFRWRFGADTSVSAPGWYIDDVQITSALPPNPAPVLLSITPDNGSNLSPTPVVVTGSGFIGQPALQLGTTWLEGVTVVNSTTLNAIVPAGMLPGIYDLTLYNGDCQPATLQDAFTVTAGQEVSLGKQAPAEAMQGDVISYTITLDAGGPITGTAILTDVLPAGVTYAGGLTATFGSAWYDAGDNAVYWSYGLPLSGGTVTPNTNVGNPERLAATPQGSQPAAQSVPMTDLILDGSFELGTPNPYWLEYSTNFFTPLCTVGDCGFGGGTGPHTGNWWAWFGGIEFYEEGILTQTVTIPVGTATLSFWLETPVCDSPADYLEVLVDGTQVFLVDGSSAQCNTVGYTLQTVDVSAFADGNAHDLVFYSESFGVNGGVSNFFVDDVVLDSQIPATVTITFNVTVTLLSGVITNVVDLDYNGSLVSATAQTTVLAPPVYYTFLPMVVKDFTGQ